MSFGLRKKKKNKTKFHEDFLCSALQLWGSGVDQNSVFPAKGTRNSAHTSSAWELMALRLPQPFPALENSTTEFHGTRSILGAEEQFCSHTTPYLSWTVLPPGKSRGISHLGKFLPILWDSPLPSSGTNTSHSHQPRGFACAGRAGTGRGAAPPQHSRERVPAHSRGMRLPERGCRH